MSNSRIPGLYRLKVGERIDELLRLGWLAESDAAALRQGRCVLSPVAADRIIENVIATFGLPLAIAANFWSMAATTSCRWSWRSHPS